MSFDQPLESARAINVGGTRRMLEFATLAQQHGGLDRYAQVSTAYVAGTHTGRFTEDDLDVGQEFRNTYEQSKFESEQMVRTEAEHLPWMILRPSIVVGDRSSGWTSAFNVMYWPLRALSTGLFRAVPAMPESPLDIVSIDYVADAIYELCECPQDSAHRTFHLTASEDASSLCEIVSLASRYFRKPEPQAVPPAEFNIGAGSLSDAAIEASRVYFPYFSIADVFDNARTRARLAQAGIHCTPLREYLDRLLDFATSQPLGQAPDRPRRGTGRLVRRARRCFARLTASAQLTAGTVERWLPPLRDALRPFEGGGGAVPVEALELFAEVLSQSEHEAAIGDDFYDRLCSAVCRLARLRRAIIFRYDPASRQVRAAGAHGVDIEGFTDVQLSVDTAPIAAQAIREDQVVEAEGDIREQLPPAIRTSCPSRRGSCAARWSRPDAPSA